MSYNAKDYASLIGINGLSEKLLTNHFSLYEAYVRNINLIDEKLREVEKESIEFAELKRRFGWEFNGMRLHELYFENLTNEPQPIESFPDIFNKIEIDFGSVEKWQDDFRSVCLSRGIGWAVLYHDRWADKLFNVWVNEHDGGHLAGCRPLLVADVFEHAFMPDGLRKPDYVDIVLAHINWSSAEDRMKATA